MTRQRLAGLAFVVSLTVFAIAGLTPSPAQPPGKGKGMKADGAFAADRDTFHYLLDHRKEIRRSVKDLPNGVETITESDNLEVAGKIQEHAAAMHKRLKEGSGIHYRDPLFAEIFKYRDRIVMKVEKTAKGVKVTETSDDRYAVKLIQAHAAVVSKFIENGYDEVHKNHPLPEKTDPKKP